MQQYVVGWAENGFQYAAIPLEVQAYTLQNQFETAPEFPFDVENRVCEEFGFGGA